MRILYTIALGFIAALSWAQPVKEYFFLMRMDGEHTLESGHVTKIWGFSPEAGEGGDEELRLPSPTIRVQEGDSVVVRVINPSEEGHTIHWHGLDVDQANDGVPAFSQFVLKGDTFHYRFRATHAGNYIYHCHVTTTLHLMMGMYGSFIVDRPDQRVFAGGPRYDRDYDYLGSELDQSWNDNYMMTGPFYTFEADHFLLNGKSGQQIYADSALHVQLRQGDTVLLRLINIGYGIHTYEFPPAVTATAVASDGRAIPQAFTTSALDLYPGERYSVLLTPNSTQPIDHIRVLYKNMIDRKVKGYNYIPINTSQAPVGIATGGERPSFYPNPVRHTLQIANTDQPIVWRVFSATGQFVDSGSSPSITTSSWPSGWYVVEVQTADEVWREKVVKR